MKDKRPSNPPDEIAQHVSKKSPSDELFLLFFFESSESDRVFNYLHDSNAIFRAGRINSEWVFRRTVIKSPKNSARGTTLPMRLLHEAFVISVL